MGKLSVSDFPKITFGIIVLNGEPFIRYCLQALYPHAYEIIVAEGAVESARGFANENGSSLDKTLEILNDFKTNHDPEDKVKIVTKDGFWKDKDEQSRAYAQLATGDYLWQVDADEFYRSSDIEKIRELLVQDPTITGASFRWLNFWGGSDTIVDGWFLQRGGGDVNRLMKWGPGYIYGKHTTGPRSFAPDGADMTKVNWLSASSLAASGIIMFHYSLVFPDQVFAKSLLYKRRIDLALDPIFSHDRADIWAKDVWLNLKRPFDVHNRYGEPAWLEHFNGEHPAAAAQMFDDIRAGRLSCEMRSQDDIKKMLASRFYQIKRFVARVLFPISVFLGDSPRGYWFTRAVFVWLNQGSFSLGLAISKKVLRKLRFI